MARAEAWFIAPERCADRVARRNEEDVHVSELTLALEAPTWFNRKEAEL